jgi:hypothetical protein
MRSNGGTAVARREITARNRDTGRGESSEDAAEKSSKIEQISK